MASTILIIDDSELILHMLTMVCTQAGYDVQTCAHFGEVEAAVRSCEPDLIVTDLNLPDVVDTVASLRAILSAVGHESRPIIIISGQPQADLDAIAAQRGAQAALSKDAGLPAISQDLPVLIQSLLP